MVANAGESDNRNSGPRSRPSKGGSMLGRRIMHLLPTQLSGPKFLFLSLLLVLAQSGCRTGHRLEVQGRDLRVSADKIGDVIVYKRNPQTVEAFDAVVTLDFPRVSVSKDTLANGLSYTIKIGDATLLCTQDDAAWLQISPGDRLAVYRPPTAGKPALNATPKNTDDELDEAVLAPLDIGFKLGTIPLVLVPRLKRSDDGRDAVSALANLLLGPTPVPFEGYLLRGGPFTGTLLLTRSGRERLAAVLHPPMRTGE